MSSVTLITFMETFDSLSCPVVAMTTVLGENTSFGLTRSILFNVQCGHKKLNGILTVQHSVLSRTDTLCKTVLLCSEP